VGDAASAPLLNVHTIAFPQAVRAAGFGLHLSVAGLLAGAMFPIALPALPRAARHEHVLQRCDRVRAGAGRVLAGDERGRGLARGGRAVLTYAAVGGVVASRR
jgi:hypothetical protein